ncbi:hypothetical protein GQ42DRAFT_83170 [Ramicandelaber brevisporus]|nr:hypothetical protein GQ42DRAFT_83170 [Ramicandelaber brevisporus]
MPVESHYYSGLAAAQRRSCPQALDYYASICSSAVASTMTATNAPHQHQHQHHHHHQQSQQSQQSQLVSPVPTPCEPFPLDDTEASHQPASPALIALLTDFVDRVMPHISTAIQSIRSIAAVPRPRDVYAMVTRVIQAQSQSQSHAAAHAHAHAHTHAPVSVSVSSTTADPVVRQRIFTAVQLTRLTPTVCLFALAYTIRFLLVADSAALAVRAVAGSEPALSAAALPAFSSWLVGSVLSNKLFEDNTFSNKSWSDVSGLETGSITAMERALLNGYKFDVHMQEDEVGEYTEQLRQWWTLLVPSSSAAASAQALQQLHSLQLQLQLQLQMAQPQPQPQPQQAQLLTPLPSLDPSALNSLLPSASATALSSARPSVSVTPPLLLTGSSATPQSLADPFLLSLLGWQAPSAPASIPNPLLAAAAFYPKPVALRTQDVSILLDSGLYTVTLPPPFGSLATPCSNEVALFHHQNYALPLVAPVAY